MGCEKPFKIPFLNVAYFASSTKRRARTAADKGNLETRDPKQFFSRVFLSFVIDTAFLALSTLLTAAWESTAGTKIFVAAA